MPTASFTVQGIGQVELTAINPRPLAKEVELTLNISSVNPNAWQILAEVANGLDRVVYTARKASPKAEAQLLRIVASCGGYENKAQMTGYIAHLLSDICSASARKLNPPRQGGRKKSTESADKPATKPNKPPQYVNTPEFLTGRR